MSERNVGDSSNAARSEVVEKTWDGSESAGLREALAGLFELVETGELVRDISRDSQPDYLRRMVKLMQTLKAAQVALASHPDRKESDARSIQYWNNLRLLREAAQAVIDWEQEYRTLNHLGKNPPHPFVQLAIALAAPAIGGE